MLKQAISRSNKYIIPLFPAIAQPKKSKEAQQTESGPVDEIVTSSQSSAIIIDPKPGEPRIKSVERSVTDLQPSLVKTGSLSVHRIN